jgi:hypothetical protein
MSEVYPYRMKHWEYFKEYGVAMRDVWLTGFLGSPGCAA